jgi:hypothetical protein
MNAKVEKVSLSGHIIATGSIFSMSCEEAAAHAPSSIRRGHVFFRTLRTCATWSRSPRPGRSWKKLQRRALLLRKFWKLHRQVLYSAVTVNYLLFIFVALSSAMNSKSRSEPSLPSNCFSCPAAVACLSSSCGIFAQQLLDACLAAVNCCCLSL